MTIKDVLLEKKRVFLEKIDDMDPGSRNLMFILLGVIAVGGAYRVISMNVGDSAAKKTKSAPAAQAGVVIEDMPDAKLPDSKVLRALPTNPRNTGLDDLKMVVEELKTNNERMARRLDAYEHRTPQATNGEAGGLSGALPNPTAGGASAPVPPVDTTHLNAPLDAPLAPVQPPARSSEFEIVRPQAAKGASRDKAAVKPDLSMPRGVGLEAVLVTGIDAYIDTTSSRSKPNVTGKGGSANLFTPFVAKIKGAAIMPNNWKNSALVDCFVMGSAMGNLSSERAYLRADGISCIAESGEVFEGTMDALGFGEDGKAGMSGTVVSKQGSLLMRTFLASTVGGFANVLTPTPMNSFNSTAMGNQKQQYTWPDPAYAGQSALAGGFSKSAEMLAQFYLDYAKQMLPVVEVIGGRRVTFILQDTLTVSKFVANQ
ncbi:MAG: hypothetical protein FD131_3223 [Rhodocyclaceae bacterium]|nr:MAG: hypothetical protein FD131_3223 [Rhodocyclaceae bacterium]